MNAIAICAGRIFWCSWVWLTITRRSTAIKTTFQVDINTVPQYIACRPQTWHSTKSNVSLPDFHGWMGWRYIPTLIRQTTAPTADWWVSNIRPITENRFPFNINDITAVRLARMPIMVTTVATIRSMLVRAVGLAS